MDRSRRAATAVALAASLTIAAGLTAGAQSARTTPSGGAIEPVSGFTGEMSMRMEAAVPEDMAVTEVIRFEPWQMLDELFRDDLVFVMRSGPSDWGQADLAVDAPAECDGQRLLSRDGHDRMRQLGALLVVNELRPGRVLVSHTCRAQLTYAALEAGMLGVDMDAMDGMTVAGDARLDAAEAGGANAADAMREAVMGWDGGDGDGPLLVVSHFPNIAALTEFNVYEGEMLIVDPKRDGRVLGYLRLASAAPDPVRFDQSVVDHARGLSVH